MLIDTNRIISKTKLREDLSKILMLVAKGKEMLVTDRGKPLVRLSPALIKKQNAAEILRKMDQLANRLKDYKSDIPAVDFIRKMRDSRK